MRLKRMPRKVTNSITISIHLNIQLYTCRPGIMYPAMKAATMANVG